MKIFKFTLVLKNVNENTNNLEDSLYEANCDDALIDYRNGVISLNFDREGSSLEEAVISAINDVQSSSVEAYVARVAPDNLVTESEIAKRLELSRQIVSLWINGKRRKSFPHPTIRLTEKSPLWNWNEVVEWLHANKIIHNSELVENAAFIANMNAALEERDSKTRKIRHALLKKISLQNLQRN